MTTGQVRWLWKVNIILHLLLCAYGIGRAIVVNELAYLLFWIPASLIWSAAWMAWAARK